MSLLTLRDVTKLYRTDGEPVPALVNVSMDVEAGEFLALVGRSGCGKSTLLNLCGAMDFPTSGEVSIDGQVTSSMSDNELTRLRREKVGFIFQSFQLLHTLSVAENVELPLLLGRRPYARQQALERLDWVEMASLADRLPHQLSGGQQQRVAIARALVHNPRLLLADEPTGNLDTITGEIVLRLLKRIANDLRVTVLMATHNPESTEMTNAVIKMRDGRIEEAVALQ